MLGLSGCRGDLSTLDAAGPAAAHIATLWWVMLTGAALILAGVLALAAWAWRQSSAGAAHAGRWQGGWGVGFTLAVLLALLGYALVLGERLLPHPAPEVLRVQATARQWQWAFAVPVAGGVHRSVDELTIPAGVPIDVAIEAEDVIHSFWVPRLAGKMDAIPGKTNVLRIQASEPGLYRGVCAEYCGSGHARHTLTVVALGAEDWQRWQREVTR